MRKLVEAQPETPLPGVNCIHELHVVDEYREPLGFLFPLEIEAVLLHPRLEQAQDWTIGVHRFKLTKVEISEDSDEKQ